MRYLPLILAFSLAACAATAETPLMVASTAIDASRAVLPHVCPYSSPVCDTTVASLNAVIAGYNLALDAEANGVAVDKQAVADAAVAVLHLIQSITPDAGGAK
jgi:hypothetical protein